jgi:hypothetical protein
MQQNQAASTRGPQRFLRNALERQGFPALDSTGRATTPPFLSDSRSLPLIQFLLS